MDKDLKQYLDKKFDGVDKHLGAVDNRLGGMDKRLGGMDTRLDKIDKRLDGVDKRLDGMDKRFISLENKIDDAVDELAQIIAVTVANPLQQHIEETRDYPTVRKDVALLKHDMTIVKQKLQIKT